MTEEECIRAADAAYHAAKHAPTSQQIAVLRQTYAGLSLRVHQGGSEADGWRLVHGYLQWSVRALEWQREIDEGYYSGAVLRWAKRQRKLADDRRLLAMVEWENHHLTPPPPAARDTIVMRLAP